jgi:two-component system, NtrC family, sensor kinase
VKFHVHIPGGMAFRIFLLTWVITILTLGMFVLAIIPEQKRDLRDALHSKAQGISYSLQEVTVGAAISEDYSSVVDQCAQVLAGDNAIDYLVIAKNDGLAVIVERSGWRTETLGDFWRPAARSAAGGILQVPYFNRRVYAYSRPFDYSAIQWGWIHVGLSLEMYDRSVTAVYRRTGMLAILGVVLSFVASVTYARRQVRPIKALQSVVQQVAGGDLTARAPIQGGYEIEDLGRSFNLMADTILRRNQTLEGVRFAAQEFLGAASWETAVGRVLGKLGAAVAAGSACLYENGSGEPSYTWQSDGPGREDGTAEAARPDWMDRLRAGETVLPAPAGGSRVFVPIHVGEEFFGYLLFRDARSERVWSDAERDSFRAVAGMLGTSIARQRAQRELLEAKQTLEVRVRERTAELWDQIGAKEKAHTQLAEAQQRLIKLSRLSGMAEVATGVLHNVGNVLNSVNVSSTLVATRIREMRVDNLATTVELIREHESDLSAFLENDPKGRRVLPYLYKVTRHFRGEREALLSELELLRSHVGHIKEIVATQQNYAKVSGLIEDVCLASLAEDALRIVHSGVTRREITVERDFEEVPSVPADKHKILQILLNLMRNAQQAIKAHGGERRVIRIGIRRWGDDAVRLEVGDSGIGLSREDLTRIFAHGYTTKPDGHGFGLHSGALAAREMGGRLWAESDGPGRGATFILELQMARKTTMVESVA